MSSPTPLTLAVPMLCRVLVEMLAGRRRKMERDAVLDATAKMSFLPSVG